MKEEKTNKKDKRDATRSSNGYKKEPVEAAYYALSLTLKSKKI
jgi:hypothetical protein